MPVLSHWVQDLPLYEDPPATVGAVGKKFGDDWDGCVLKSCKSPKKFQNRCPEEEDAPALSLYGTELAQDAVFASNLGMKATAVAAYMRRHSQEFKKDIKAIWANNGKALLMAFPGNRPEVMQPDIASDYIVHLAQFQQKNPSCKSGKNLGELRIGVSVQQFIAENGEYDVSPLGGHGEKAVPLLRIKIQNDCEDCGATIDKGFYLRIQHTANRGGGKPGNPQKKCTATDYPKMVGQDDGSGGIKQWDDTFEFTGRKALTCGSAGSFDVLLTNLQQANKATDTYHWPCELRITIVSPCREELAFMHLIVPGDGVRPIAPSSNWFWS